MNRTYVKKPLAIAVILLFFSVSVIPSTGTTDVKQSTVTTAKGDTLYVGGNGTGNYSKIQDAIDNASDGDTVFVYDDSSPYYENVVVNKSINLIGEDKDTTVIDGSGSGDVIYISADWVNLSGFKLENFYGISLFINSSYNNISCNHFSGFDWAGYVGIELSNENNNNIISDNIFYRYGYHSIHITDFCTNTAIINNTFLENHHDLAIRNSCHNTTIIGNKIIGTGCCVVIDISSSNNNIIKDNYLAPDWIHGIELHSSHNNTIYNSTIIGNMKCLGVELINSKDNNIFDNSLFRSGLTVWNTSQNNVINNTVNNKPLVYLENTSDSIIPDNTGQVVLINCDNITVQNQDLSNTSEGISLWETTNCSISDCLISNSYNGIKTYYSNNNTITGNNIKNKNGRSIELINSHYNTIMDNNITNNYGEIKFDKSQYNTIMGNNISNNDWGIVFWNSQYNIITDNIITNGYKGIELYHKSNQNNITSNIISNQEGDGICIWPECYNNIIYHNNFINNEYNNAVDSGSNTWDNGYPSGGNYWDDYEGEDNNYDGIGDTPYQIPGGNNKDRYPLMYPFGGNQPPDVEIINPKEGYFHFSGIPILLTPFDLIADTMSIGGFRLYPIIINATDDSDNSSDLIVKIFLNGEEQGNATYCCDWRLHEWFWTGFALGTYTLTVTAEDSFGAISSAEMEVWNLCVIK